MLPIIGCVLALVIAVPRALAGQSTVAAEQTAVKHFLVVFNDSLLHHDRQRLSSVITSDTQVWTGSGTQARGIALLLPLLAEPLFWSESTVPQLRNEAIRFLSPAVAVLTAELVQYGSWGLRTTPVVTILRKNHSSWRLAYIGLFTQVTRMD